ncbi:MAG: hypothetical protein D6773_16495 [Alphaproteobacteria bacterium]|nr:MAG: hypothetical protein D6773_16495 [Alphaproteobacteria bacterium]
MRLALAFLALLLPAPGAGADADSSRANIPAYRAAVPVMGQIRLSGSPADRRLIEALESGFASHHPDVRFSERLHGPESTLAAVYTDVADIAFMAREIREPMERMAFEWVKLAKPFSVEIANAGFAIDRPAHQLAVYVHQDNPLQALSLPVLEAIFGARPTRGVRKLESWGELGLTGDWRERPIKVFGPELDSIDALFFRRTVMHDSRKWNPGYREFASADALFDALRKEPTGIAFAPFVFHHPDLRVLPLSARENGTYYAPNRETVIARTYPLTRSLTVIFHRPPRESAPPAVAAFVRFLLSAEGQAIIESESCYLPLDGETIAAQLRRLGT